MRDPSALDVSIDTNSKYAARTATSAMMEMERVP
jgi:hypothetical protein